MADEHTPKQLINSELLEEKRYGFKGKIKTLMKSFRMDSEDIQTFASGGAGLLTKVWSGVATYTCFITTRSYVGTYIEKYLRHLLLVILQIKKQLN